MLVRITSFKNLYLSPRINVSNCILQQIRRLALPSITLNKTTAERQILLMAFKSQSTHRGQQIRNFKPMSYSVFKQFKYMLHYHSFDLHLQYVYCYTKNYCTKKKKTKETRARGLIEELNICWSRLTAKNQI